MTQLTMWFIRKVRINLSPSSLGLCLGFFAFVVVAGTDFTILTIFITSIVVITFTIVVACTDPIALITVVASVVIMVFIVVITSTDAAVAIFSSMIIGSVVMLGTSA